MGAVDLSSRYCDGPTSTSGYGRPTTCNSVSTPTYSFVPSLAECCERTLTRLINLQNVLSLLELSQTMLYVFPDAPRLQERCERFIVNTFDTLCEVEGKEAVRKAIPQDSFELLERASMERQQVMRRLQVRGKVLDAVQPSGMQKPGCSPPRRISYENRDLSGSPPRFWMCLDCPTSDAVYPYEWLLEGMQWPEDVHPVYREQHLSEEDFVLVFGMTRAQFWQLPQWRQLRLKKDAKLY